MRNIPFEVSFPHARLSKEVQIIRLQQIIQEVLSPAQREILEAYYYEGQSIPRIAHSRGVHKSTVSRTLHRAEKKLRQYLKY